jgi:epsilon-lactone hydrolase
MTIETIKASPQGIQGIAAVRAMLAGQPDDADTDLATRRARLVALSAATPKPVGVDIAELRINGVRVLRIDPPQARGQALYLHGGAYVLGSADTHLRLAAHYALASGARVWSVDYRLAPEHPYPAALDDALAVWPGAREAEPTAVIGDSAGGGLALALAQQIRDHGLGAPAALALVSPWADLTLSNNAITAKAAVEIMLSRRGLALDADRYSGAIDVADPRISPLYADMAHLPPTFIQVGTDEMLFDDSMLLAARIEAAGGSVHLQIWEGMAHAWPAFGDAVPEAAASIAALGTFCRDRLTEDDKRI